MTTLTADPRPDTFTTTVSWRESAEQAARRLSAIGLAGALLGLLVGGVGSRLAMMLLARLNPEVTGITSDDGFVMGQFTLRDTLGLLLLGTVFGLVGAGVYAVVREWMLGPRWFQVLSVAGGPAVVVGAGIVHTDGVDFYYLDPVWLAIALFVAIPGIYAALLTVVVERWLADGGWAARRPLAVAAAPLLLWVLVAPLLAVLVLLWGAREALLRSAAARLADHPALPWLGRAALAAVFVVALADLGRDVTTLT